MKYQDIAKERLRDYKHKRNAVQALTEQTVIFMEQLKLLDDSKPNADVKQLNLLSNLNLHKTLLRNAMTEVKAVERALNALDEEQRELLTVVYIEGGSLPEWSDKKYISKAYGYKKAETALFNFAKAAVEEC